MQVLISYVSLQPLYKGQDHLSQRVLLFGVFSLKIMLIFYSDLRLYGY